MRKPPSQHSLRMTQNDLLSTAIHLQLLRPLAEISLRIPWALVLLVLVSFSLWSLASTQQAVDPAISAAHISDLYDQARYEVNVEETQVEQYRNQPAPATKALFQHAATLLTTALLTISHDGDKHDHIAAHMEKADGISEPIFAQFKQVVSSETNANRQQAIQSLYELNRVKQVISITTPLIFGIGLLLISTFWMVQQRYQRRLDKAIQSELVRFEHAASTDNLTELGNHRAYQEDLADILTAEASPGTSLALALIDVDQLKLINETSGHREGDRVLTAFAAILRSGQRFECMYRLGGDEFAVIVPQVTLCEATDAMEQLRHEAEQGLFGATVSIGIASTLLDDSDSAEKIGRAHELDYVCVRAILARAAELPPDALLFST